MIKEILKDAETRMQKSVSSMQTDLAKIRTGRAHPSLVDHITVDYYGSDVPLSQVANVAVEDSRTLSITPWEAPMVKVVEKAIMTSDLGLNPMTAGNVIRIPLPPLTEERRKEFVKLAKQEIEGGRVAVRNIRRDAMSDLKDLQKEKEISEDEERSASEQVQKLTDKYIAEMDALLAAKETELMAI